MNLLIDIVPTVVGINGIEYEINSDFRTSILFELMMQDNELDDKEKIIQALNLYYPEIPEDINKAVDMLLWFYRGGKDITSNGKGAGKGKAEQIYSFDYDDDYIYSAFLDQYRVDLQDIPYLHWWKFKAMFKSLKEDNEIVKIMGYRAMDLSKVRDKEQRAYYKKMKDLYKIPAKINKNEQEKLNDIQRALMGDGNVSSVL
jgi:hypothetical protein